ncbi:Sentrin-specific protease 2 [Liparis tanakae]|uniref:Sentrin-specific protease 2 n=1 Tax=Liparis tanakae TaxID=230148 RepID=A0A4Z2DYX3_9TELE|nr:Sentrin-specific protease 2 [Liparis tanakae]
MFDCNVQQKPAADLDLSTEVATRLNLSDREAPDVSRPDAHAAYTWRGDEDTPRLTKEMAAEVSCALAHGDPNRVLSAAFKLRITQRDLATLQEGGWINDEAGTRESEGLFEPDGEPRSVNAKRRDRVTCCCGDDQ